MESTPKVCTFSNRGFERSEYPRELLTIQCNDPERVDELGIRALFQSAHTY